MMVYLAHPIDFAGEYYDSIIEAAHEAKTLLLDCGAACVYTPADAWSVNLPMSPAVQRINTEALINSDVMMVISPEGSRSYGVPFEMGIAHAYGIPMVYVTSGTPARARELLYTSALFAYLNPPIFSDVELEQAAHEALLLARVAKYPNPLSRPTESHGDTKERTGK